MTINRPVLAGVGWQNVWVVFLLFKKAQSRLYTKETTTAHDRHISGYIKALNELNRPNVRLVCRN